MKKIGKGWQYVVYDLGNGKVKKEKYSKILQLLLILRDLFGEGKLFPYKEAICEQERMNTDNELSISYLNSINNKLDWKILGNPKFFDDESYEQDKVEPLYDVFKKVSGEEGKRVFDKYLELIYRTWEYGFSDKIFNFSINNGLNLKGEVIQLDFGELSFDKEEMRKDIANKVWLKRYSYLTFPKGELRDYFVEIMNPIVMTEQLNKRWGTKL